MMNMRDLKTIELAEPKIVDAVIAPSGERFIAFGQSNEVCWISTLDLQQNQSAVFQRLERHGISLLRGPSREKFKGLIEARKEYRAGFVAPTPGWTDGVYARPDGSVWQRRTERRHIMTAFNADHRFSSTGTLADWQLRNGPLVAGQPLVLFLYTYALVGYLIGLAPARIQNAIIELVGAAHVGKTTLAVGAASVCGGDPSSDIGFGLSWDKTVGSYDRLKREHRDSLLFLDEANLISGKPNERAEKISAFLFKLAQTGERETIQLPGTRAHTRLAVLSTSNTPLDELISGDGHAKNAALSRVLTVRADRPYGIFDHVPVGFQDAEEAVHAMLEAALSNYGVAGAAFVEGLCRYTEAGVRNAIERSLSSDKTKRLLAHIANPRARNILAMTICAGRFATQLGVYPESWGSIEEAVSCLFPSGAPPAEVEAAPQNAAERYVRQNAASFIDVSTLQGPLPGIDFDRTAGFWIEDGKRCVVPTAALKAIPAASHALKDLRLKGVLDGEAKKLAKRPPTSICASTEYKLGYFLSIARDDVLR